MQSSTRSLASSGCTQPPSWLCSDAGFAPPRQGDGGQPGCRVPPGAWLIVVALSHRPDCALMQDLARPARVMAGNLDAEFHREPGSKWPGFLVNRSGLPLDDRTWNQVRNADILTEATARCERKVPKLSISGHLWVSADYFWMQEMLRWKCDCVCVAVEQINSVYKTVLCKNSPFSVSNSVLVRTWMMLEKNSSVHLIMNAFKR